MINNARNGYRPNVCYGVTQSNSHTYFDNCLVRLLRDIILTGSLNKPTNIFADSGLSAQYDIDAAWDFILRVAFHELCHWGRLNPDASQGSYTDPQDKLPLLLNAILIPDPNDASQIEHGWSWEMMAYGSIQSWDSQDVNPNVYAIYSKYLTGLGAAVLGDNNIAALNQLERQMIRKMIDIKWSEAYYYYINASGDLIP